MSNTPQTSQRGGAKTGFLIVGTGEDAIMIMAAAGAPTDGTSGTRAGEAGPGSQYTDTTNAVLYINTGTKASPTYTIAGTQS